VIKGKLVKLREKTLADAHNDFIWHTDTELAELDAATPMQVTFAQYMMEYANEMRYPFVQNQRFAIETLDGKHIGNCAYYGLDEANSETEVGIMLGDREYWSKGYGTDALMALVDFVFDKTKLKRVHLKTLDWNIRAQRSFMKCGFVPFHRETRDEYCFLLMEMSRENWAKLRKERQTPG